MYSEGSLDSKIVLVGEAPAAEEVRQRRPFVGPAGQLLDSCLTSAGLTRSQCYITNVVKEQPNRNDISTFVQLDKTHVTRTPAYERYEQELYNELAQTNADVYVALGNVSLYALTRLTNITKRRGSILPCTVPTLPGRKVVACLHPASALIGRDPLHKYLIILDLIRAKEEIGSWEYKLPKYNIKLRPTFQEAFAFLSSILATKPMIAFDIEVHMRSYEMNCISFATPDSVMSIPFISSDGDYFTVFEESQIMRKIAEILQHPEIVKVTQNGNFDSTFLFNKYGIRAEPLEDTMIAQRILYPDFPKGLDFICSMWTKTPYYKNDGKMIIKGLESNDDRFWEYNAKDSAVCLEAFPKQVELLKKYNNYETYKRQVGILPALRFMQARGNSIDIEGMKRASQEALNKISELYEELKAIVGPDMPSTFTNSSKQLIEYFYKKLKYPPYKNQGRVTVDDEALKRLARKGCREASLIRDMRKWKKLRGTYFEMTIDPDGKLRSSYNPAGATTGRLSSSKTIFGTGGNLQNMAKPFKALLRADPGYLIFEADLSQAENRLVAFLGPEPKMKQAFLNGEDIHCKTYGMMFNIKTEDVSDLPGSSTIGDGSKSQRHWGKTFNHALNYGLGYKSFALRYEIQESEAKKLVELYHTVYPGVRGGFQAAIKNELWRTKMVTNPYGRRRVFLGLMGDELFKDAYAFKPQSTVADKINLDGLIFIQSNLKEVELLNQIHDSVVFQIPVSVGWERMAELLQAIITSLESPIPHTTPFSIPVEIKGGISLGKMSIIPKPVSPATLQALWESLNESNRPNAEDQHPTISLDGYNDGGLESEESEDSGFDLDSDEGDE